MLRRQQAEAVIAARQKIVHGAVSMVDMALKELAHKDVVSLDDERKAANVQHMVGPVLHQAYAVPGTIGDTHGGLRATPVARGIRRRCA